MSVIAEAAPRARCRLTSGFTLVELLVVIIIMGLGLSLFFGINYHQRESFRWRKAQREVRMFLCLARSFAILEGRADDCFLQSDIFSLRESLRGRRLQLPEGVQFELDEQQREQIAEFREQLGKEEDEELYPEIKLVTFYGDGGAAGGPLFMKAGRHRARIEIDPLVGEIRIVEEEPVIESGLP